MRQKREEEGDQSRPVRQQRRRPGPPRINDDEWVLVRRRPGMSSRPRGRRNDSVEEEA